MSGITLSEGPGFSPAFDIAAIRADFPILRGNRARQAARVSRQRQHEPEARVRASRRWITTIATPTRNIHRATHLLSERATAAYEGTRAKAARFINAPDTRVDRPDDAARPTASTSSRRPTGRMVLRPGDEVILSWLEHHSNIVPWQILCEQTGATLRVIPIDDRGDIELDAYDALLSERTQDRRGRPRVQRARHDQSRRADDSSRRTRAARWC